MSGILRKFFEAFVRVQRARAVDALDERTLRDIGLHEHANRARERMRLTARLGSYQS